MWIDSHCHLNHNRLRNIGPPDVVVNNARAAGVSGMLTICCRVSDEFPEILSLAKRFDDVWCTIGTHPHDAGDAAEKAVTLDELARLARSDSKIVGIGESGLDYFYKHSTPEDQQESFRKHIRACIETGLPLVVHARDADDEVIRILREEGAGQGSKLKGVMHCFSSSPKMGHEALELGFYISFSGIITFKKSAELQEFAKIVPPDRLLVETDAPFLAPEPHRGHINEPAFVALTGKFLAELKRVSAEQLSIHSRDNFFTLFDKIRKREE